MDPAFVQGLREAKALLDEGILTQVSLCITHGTRLHSVDNKRKTIGVTEPATRKPSDSARETNIERSYYTSIQGLAQCRIVCTCSMISLCLSV
jgi:hypothetical protein